MTTLLPSSSGHFEVALEASRAVAWQELESAVPFITSAKRNPPPSYLPFLVWEYGLGMLTPYIPNLYELLDEGVRWLRVRGTYAAVSQGLSFVGVTATVEPAWQGRAWWNSSQLRFSSLPENDEPLLDRIEAITRLSLPFRSDLRRGVFQYDVPAMECDARVLDGSHLERESGVRLHEGGTVWSFGRTAEFEHTLTEAEGLALGNWIVPPVAAGLKWADMQFKWATAQFRWADNPATQRRVLMARWFDNEVLHLKLRRADGSVIGYRRCRIVRACAIAANGAYRHASQTYAPEDNGQVVYVEAMTGFADAADEAVASVELVAFATLTPVTPSGRLWLEHDEVSGGVPFAAKAVQRDLRKTVRDQFKFLLRF